LRKRIVSRRDLAEDLAGLRDLFLLCAVAFFFSGEVDCGAGVFVSAAWDAGGGVTCEEAFVSPACCCEADEHTKAHNITERKITLEEFPNTSL